MGQEKRMLLRKAICAIENAKAALSATISPYKFDPKVGVGVMQL